MNQPTPGFEFPQDAQDIIEQQLRDQVARQQPLRSVRPERQKPPVVTPSVAQAVPVRPMAAKVSSMETTPVAEPLGISIDLPSRFTYYSFKDLYVRPFRVSHLAKVAKAHETSSMQSLAEVVSSVLMTPTGETNVAFKLTMADFNAVLYWLRLNSFSQKQMRITSKCTNPEHNRQVEIGAKPKESLNITTLYTQSALTMNYLDNAPDPETYSVDIEGYGRVALRPETVEDVYQFLDHPDWEDPEFQYVARIASVIGLPLSLSEKVSMVNDGALSTDAAVLALEFAELVDSYGVEEMVATKCIGCGASGVVKTAVDALSFLSPEF